MLTIKTYLDKSDINGIGCFAGEFVPKGTVLWKLQKNFDIVFTDEHFNDLPEMAKKHVLHHAYYNTEHGGYVLCTDDAKFFNHSQKPNTDDIGELTIAKEDINPGTEIVSDYFSFDKLASDKIR